MKVAVLSESEADEAAILVLLSGVLGEEVEVATGLRLRHRGVDAVYGQLRAVLLHLHYATDVERLVVVVDSDLTAIHQRGHRDVRACDRRCRLCRLRDVVRDTMAHLRPIGGRPVVKTALGLAVPQIEAWYLVGGDARVSEAAWINGLASGRPPYTAEQVKVKVYGTPRPSIELETRCARRESQRIVRDGKLALLEQFFPSGFGAFAEDVRAWGT
ncbi:MAG: hypothetical protein NUV77_05005 [Thermoguttaceae bacterium]|jgi:hypothetical protein|nr:hypothetical protein [Thermoguttaceae bacterium]